MTTSRSSLSLYNIENELLELLQLREEVEGDQAAPPDPAELAEIDKQVQAYVEREVRKADGIGDYLNECITRADALEAEAQRIRERAGMWRRRYESVRNTTLRVMQLFHLKTVEGVRHTLAVKRNPPSVEIRQPDLVPDQYQCIAVKLSLDVWKAVLDVVDTHDSEHSGGALSAALKAAERKASYDQPLTPVKEALKAACPKCLGSGLPERQAALAGAGHCDACGGTGHAGVPGCELVTDIVRLEVD